MRKTLLVSILLMPLMMIASQIAYGGANPPNPPDEGFQFGQYIGPDITGTGVATAIYDTNNKYVGVLYTFDGTCKNFSFNFDSPPFPLLIPWDCVTPEYLLGTCDPDRCGCNGLPQQIGNAPDQCHPQNKYVNPSPVVYKVVHFTDNGDTKTFDIVGRWLTIIPVK